MPARPVSVAIELSAGSDPDLHLAPPSPTTRPPGRHFPQQPPAEEAGCLLTLDLATPALPTTDICCVSSVFTTHSTRLTDLVCALATCNHSPARDAYWWSGLPDAALSSLVCTRSAPCSAFISGRTRGTTPIIIAALLHAHACAPGLTR